MFSVGDRVRVVGGCEYGLEQCKVCPPVGHIGVITDIDDYDVPDDGTRTYVDLDNWHDNAIPIVSIELIDREKIDPLPLPG